MVKNRAVAGYVHIYTGPGKGKTTAALGLALRAAGHGWRTFFAQFLKGRPTGELEAAKRLSPLIVIEQFGRHGLINVQEGPDDEDIARAREGLRRSLEAMLSGQYRIVVLDEINTAVHLGLLGEGEVLSFLDRRPPEVEVVLTGRYAPSAFLDRADLVTEMACLKHYSDKGVKARDGIER